MRCGDGGHEPSSSPRVAFGHQLQRGRRAGFGRSRSRRSPRRAAGPCTESRRPARGRCSTPRVAQRALGVGWPWQAQMARGARRRKARRVASAERTFEYIDRAGGYPALTPCRGQYAPPPMSGRRPIRRSPVLSAVAVAAAVAWRRRPSDRAPGRADGVSCCATAMCWQAAVRRVGEHYRNRRRRRRRCRCPPSRSRWSCAIARRSL